MKVLWLLLVIARSTPNRPSCFGTDKNTFQSKEKDKDQESIQSSTTPNPGHYIGK